MMFRIRRAMGSRIASDQLGAPTSFSKRLGLRAVHAPRISAVAAEIRQRVFTTQALTPLVTVFVLYFIAGKLGQATTNIRSSNLGPVWPAYGIALAACLA